MGGELVTSDPAARIEDTLSSYALVLQNVKTRHTLDSMRALPGTFDRGERLVSLASARFTGRGKSGQKVNGFPVIVAITSTRILLAAENDPANATILDPDEWSVAQVKQGLLAANAIRLVRGSDQIKLKNLLPYAEAGRFLNALGREPDKVAYQALPADYPKDPGHPPVAALGDIAVYEDRMITPEWRHLPFNGDVQAMADAAGNIAVTRGRNLAAKGMGTLLLGPIGLLAVGNAKQYETDTRELYLLVEGPGWAYTKAFNPSIGGPPRQFAQQINVAARQHAQRSGPPDSEAASATTSSPTSVIGSELRELAALRDEGILSAEEFEEQKQKLLKRS